MARLPWPKPESGPEVEPGRPARTPRSDTAVPGRAGRPRRRRLRRPARRQLAALSAAGWPAGSRTLAGSGFRGVGSLLADVLADAAPRLRIRDAATLRAHHPGLSDDEIADTLVRNAARTTATFGAAVGALAAVEFAAPPTLLAAPVQLAAETLAVAAVEVKLIAELHEILGQPAQRQPAPSAGSAYLTSWIAAARPGSQGRRRRPVRRARLRRQARAAHDAGAPDRPQHVQAGAVPGRRGRRRRRQPPGHPVAGRQGRGRAARPAVLIFDVRERRVTFRAVPPPHSRPAPETPVEVLVQRLDPGVPLPAYALPGDAGADVVTTVDAELAPGERAVLPTGLALALPGGLRGLRAPPLRPRRALRHVAGQRARHDRLRLPRRGEGDRHQPRPGARRCGCPAATGSPSWCCRRSSGRCSAPVDALPESERGAGGHGSTGGHARLVGGGARRPGLSVGRASRATGGRDGARPARAQVGAGQDRRHPAVGDRAGAGHRAHHGTVRRADAPGRRAGAPGPRRAADPGGGGVEVRVDVDPEGRSSRPRCRTRGARRRSACSPRRARPGSGTRSEPRSAARSPARAAPRRRPRAASAPS